MLEPSWSLRIEDEAPIAVVVSVEGEAWVVPDGWHGPSPQAL
jgi:hypothetical protein